MENTKTINISQAELVDLLVIAYRTMKRYEEDRNKQQAWNLRLRMAEILSYTDLKMADIAAVNEEHENFNVSQCKPHILRSGWVESQL